MRIRSSDYWEARRELLSPPIATQTLGLRETRQAARCLSGDARDLELFGMRTWAWYTLGIRISGRTAVEVTRDPQARFLARAAAETLRERGHRVRVVIDPFVGSGNLLYHVVKETGAERGVGIDDDRGVLALTRQNFARLRKLGRIGGASVALLDGDWAQSVGFAYDDATLVIVAPPWGEAYTEDGLDLRKSVPPVLQLLGDISAGAGGDGSLFALVHTVPHVVAESVAEIRDTYPAFDTKKPADPEVAARIDYLLVQLR
jgi:hypothetical protein